MSHKKTEIASKMKGYTMANGSGKFEHAQGYTMTGKGGKGGLSMKVKLNAGKPQKTGGMDAKMHGEGTTAGSGMKYSQSNKKADFSKNYTQNGK